MKVKSFHILTILILLFPSCQTPTRPDTDTVVTEAKESVRKAERVKQKVESKQTVREFEMIEAIDALKESVGNLLGTVKKQDEYIETIEEKVKELRESFQYKIGGYVLWIGGVLIFILVSWIGLKLYVKFGTPTGVIGALLK